MIKEKIDTIFNQYPNTRIVFFWDEDKTYYDEFQDIKDNSDIKAIEVDERYFTLKYHLEYEWAKEKVLLYHPFPKPGKEDWEAYPLLGLYHANKELRVDEIAEIMERYDLKPHQEQLLKKYKNTFKTKTNQKKLAKILTPENFTEENIKLGLACISLDFTTVTDRNHCLVKLFSYSIEPQKLQTSLNRLHSYKLEEDILLWMNQRMGLKLSSLDKETVKQAVEYLKYNLIMMNITRINQNDTYSHLKIEQTAVVNKLHSLYQVWKSHPQLSGKIKQVFEETAKAIDERKLIKLYGPNENFGYYTDAMYDAILKDALEKLEQNPQQIRDESFRWKQHELISREVLLQFQFIYHASAMYAILNQYTNYSFNTAEEYITAYTKELYKVDYHYRKANINYYNIQENIAIPKKLNQVFDKLSQHYDRYLIELNVEWQKLLDTNNFDLASIDIDKQNDFYQNYIKDFDSKVAVIISDAFRYETGYELYEKLLTDSKNRVDIQPAMVSIPSDTSLGMTNLLPGKEYNAEEKDKMLEYSIDSISTSSIENRKKILQQTIKDANVIRLNELKTYNQEDGRKFFRENRIVYIYHDWIDAIGDSAKTETGAYNATQKTVEEIERLMRNLYNQWNISHILVTSDHGFIYNQGKLKDASRQDYPKAEKIIKKHARFAIGKGFEKVEGYHFPLKNSTQLDTDLEIVLPKAINRFKKQGYLGLQFSHGGASLQELLIPVIKYYKKKEGIVEKVTFKRLDNQKRINTGSIKINLLQDEPVTNELKPREIVIGLYDETGNKISNEETIVFDYTSKNPKERQKDVILTLNSKGSTKTFGYLKAFDSDDKSRLNPKVVNEKMIITQLMEKDEF